MPRLDGLKFHPGKPGHVITTLISPYNKIMFTQLLDQNHIIKSERGSTVNLL